MAVWNHTLAELKEHIENFYMDASDNDIVTYHEATIINDAINQALIDISLDFGLRRFSFLKEDTTVATVAGQAYVDLITNITGVESGTVIIASEDVTLDVMNLDYIKSVDPDLSETDVPRMYAFDKGTTADLFRLQLWPVPDSTYSISFVAKKVIDEDGVSEVPQWFHPALEDKSKAIALRNLRLYEDSAIFEMAYESRKQSAKIALETDAPIYIRRPAMVYRSNIQQRAN